MIAPLARTLRHRASVATLALAFLFAAATSVRADPAPPPAPARPKKTQLTPTTKPEVAADGNYVVWRRVSAWESRKTLKIGKLLLPEGTGEKFVSTSREYVDQLAARHPKDYAKTLRIEIAPEAWDALVKIGRRAPDPFLEKLFPKMPVMTKDQPGAIHWKAELGVVNIGVRRDSLEVFNRYVKSIVEVKSTKPGDDAAQADAAKPADAAKADAAKPADGLPPPAKPDATAPTAAKPDATAPTAAKPDATTPGAAKPTLDELAALSYGELLVRAQQQQLGAAEVPPTRPALIAALTGLDEATVRSRLATPPHGANLRGSVTGDDDRRFGIDDAIKARVVEGAR